MQAGLMAWVRRQSAREEAKSRGGLDVLCLNAGIMARDDERTRDGFEVQMQTNQLSHFLLALLTCPSLEDAASVLLSPCGRRERYSCVMVTSGQGLGDRMKVRWIVPLKLMSKLLQPIQFYPTSLPIIMMKLLFVISFNG